MKDYTEYLPIGTDVYYKTEGEYGFIFNPDQHGKYQGTFLGVGTGLGKQSCALVLTEKGFVEVMCFSVLRFDMERAKVLQSIARVKEEIRREEK